MALHPALKSDGPSTGVDETLEGFARFLEAQGALAPAARLRAQNAAIEALERFDRALVRLGLLSEQDMARQSAAYLSLQFLDSAALPAAAISIPGLDMDYLRRARIAPIAELGETLIAATADPFQPDLAVTLAFLLDRPVRIAVAEPRDVERLLAVFAAPAAGLIQEAAEPAVAREADVRRLADLASDAPIIRLVRDLIAAAVEAHASDIHLEAGETGLTVRRRVDGMLETVEVLADHLAPAVVSRIKVMAGLDIAERRLPQDGRVRVNVRGNEVDLRVATMPGLAGECVVLRILDRSSIPLDLRALGFSGPILDGFLGLLDLPHGMLLVTGPTGSGKSTSLYGALNRLNHPSRKIFTIEDPVEHRLPGIVQVQVHTRIGLTFGSSLRAMLRQDPDVIMVGEIRDLETAEMAIQSALTGHLVLSTLHTNSAADTIVRLVDMGIEDYLIASTLRGCLAQRLVRRLCDACAAPTTPSAALIACLEDEQRHLPDGSAPRSHDFSRLRAPCGCAQCRNTGFSGRIAIAELVVVTPEVARAIVDRSGGREIERAAASQGLPSLLGDGLSKVLEGETTLEEVLRVARRT